MFLQTWSSRGRPTEQNTHDPVLCQQPPVLHNGRIDPSATRNYRSGRKLASKRSLDPHTILNEDKGITMVKQGAQKIRSRYHIRKGPVRSSTPQAGGEGNGVLAYLNAQTMKRYCRSAASRVDATTGSHGNRRSARAEPPFKLGTNLCAAATLRASRERRSQCSTHDLHFPKFQSVNPGVMSASLPKTKNAPRRATNF